MNIHYTLLKRELRKRSSYNKETDCWEWHGAQSNGYGHLDSKLLKNMYGTVQIHRIVYMVRNEVVLEKTAFVMHMCDNPPCWNPKHLRIGTPKENTQDAVSKGRMSHGVGRYNAKLTDDKVLQLRIEAPTMAQRDLAKKYGITQTTCKDILHFRRWAHVGGPAYVVTDKYAHARRLNKQDIRKAFTDGKSKEFIQLKYKISLTYLNQILRGK